MNSERTIRGKVAIVGIGETRYYKHGAALEPEFQLVLEAILAAAEDAGVDVRDIDGFASYSNDRNDPARLQTALGIPHIGLSNMFWGGGGGGGSGAVANAVAGIAAGSADVAVVYRGLAQGQFGRFGQGGRTTTVSGPTAFTAPYGLMSPAQNFAMRIRRFMHEHSVEQEALRAISLVSYHHAQQNPRAVMHGRPLSAEDYDNSRWIVEPFHLFDCCQENDGAAALILAPAEKAKDMRHPPAYVLGAQQGSMYRQAAAAHNAPDYASSNFKTVAPRLYAQAGLGPSEVDVLQSYENFTGGVLMSIVEHGFCAPEGVNDFFTLDNFSAPDGALPLNTSGGNLAECYMHGLELITEAVRQIRGTSPNQIEDVNVSMVTSGPMVQPVSDLILGREAG
ncbi:MAG TPA: acetyl-CoA acetyltransferase [Dehalococcoidia bacterium]|nr:acetyl-CoA acetyltransferase [Dehalococcoidia bacterium]